MKQLRDLYSCSNYVQAFGILLCDMNVGLSVCLSRCMSICLTHFVWLSVFVCVCLSVCVCVAHYSREIGPTVCSEALPCILEL